MIEIKSIAGDDIKEVLMKMWENVWRTQEPVIAKFNGIRIVMYNTNQLKEKRDKKVVG